ncbi:inorganic phosphate transporter [Melghirimyces algeriensis]|uniref:Inorganic phosphate transporter, PiT family n=1 Tax=Melghirimyces algeriensis TaxID=910412 RepID=A0A521ERB1_9BACL|nr:inorganic phosphate transporter [Melghirimyces algeriensis]SMO85640.1 inorganic phosphate transporter, PiT family [Melghirimyces algeriensis]
MLDPTVLIVLVVLLALIFDFTNGWNDSANAIATVVGTRTLTPTKAVLLAAVLNLAGAFFSTAVAKTIGKDIVDPNHVTQMVIVATLMASIIWNTVMTILGLPVSASHGLIGSLVGAAVAYKGFAIVKTSGVTMVLVALLVSPLLGGLMAWGLMKLIRGIFRNRPPSKVKRLFHPLQILSASFMAFSHGTSDAQKAMGIITLALFAGGFVDSIEIPFWVILSAGLAMALGTAVGGWRVIKTLGMRLNHLDTPHGFAAETAAALLLTTIAKVGIPVSTTHTITGSIIGVGAAERLKGVRWGIAGKIMYAWIFTLPGTALMSWLIYQVLRVLE